MSSQDRRLRCLLRSSWNILVLLSYTLPAFHVLVKTQGLPILISAGELNSSFIYTDVNGDTWSHDKYFNGTGSTSFLPREVVWTDDDILFQKQRYGSDMKYSIPLPLGDYKVSLYLTEMTNRYSGMRVFDIVIEGEVVEDNVDLVAWTGRRRRAFVIEEDMTVIDGTLDIEFGQVSSDPTLAGIKVERYSAPSALPSATPTSSPSLSHSPTSAPSSTLLSEDAIPNPILISAGSSEPVVFEETSEIWQADQFYNGGSHAGYTKKPIRWTDKDEIYKTWREGAVVQYDIPIISGSYRVTLHFSENFYKTADSRIFDVWIEGRVVFHSLDLIQQQNFKDRRAFSFDLITEVVDGFLEIRCVAKVGNAIISAIKIESNGPHLAHAVAGGPYVAVDIKDAGSALVPVDGSLSHTHGPGLDLVKWIWMLGTTEIASGETAALDLSVGQHSVALRVIDNDGNEAEQDTQVSVLPFGNPVLYTVFPDSGDVIGGETVTLTGVGFDFREEDTVVQFGSKSLSGPSQITVLNETTIVVKQTPSAVIGAPIEVKVYTPIGLSNKQFYTYIAGVPIAFDSGTVFEAAMPTAIAFGPDGKLYVATYYGFVYKVTLDENYGVKEMVVSQVLRQAYPDQLRVILGITFSPTDKKEYPDVYISHSAVFHGESSSFEGAAVNGKISKLTGPNLGTVTDVVTGLPVSDHDHAVNGILFDDQGDLYIQVGGNTNAGVPGELSGSGVQDENVMGAATLVARLSDPDFKGEIEYDPSGFVIPGSGVDVFATGQRNSFGIVLHSNGRLYATDNGPNKKYGKKSTSCDDFGKDPEEADKLNLIEAGNFYGHANRPRGECVWQGGTAMNGNNYTPPLLMLPASTNGIVEFESNHFRGQLRGNLILGQYSGSLFRVVLDEAGDTALFGPSEFIHSGGLNLAQGPDGTLFVVKVKSGEVVFHKPAEPPVGSVTIKSIFPRRGDVGGGTLLQVFGEDLTDVRESTTVTVGGTLCPVLSSSPAKLECKLPPGSGPVDVVVRVGNKISALSKAYRYIGTPSSFAESTRASSAPSDIPSMPPSSVQPGWELLSTTGRLRKRHEACFVMVNEMGYLLGGRGIQNVSKFDPILKRWSDGAAPPIELHHMQCVVVDDSIFIVSSWTGSFPNEENTADIFIYNTTGNTWSSRHGLPEERRRGGAAAVLVERDGKREVYVSHGNRGGHGNHAIALGWLDKYDVDLDQWTTHLTDAPNPRDHTGGGLVQNGELLCVAGGRDTGRANIFNSVVYPTDCYDLKAEEWTVETSILTGRAGSAYGTTCDGKLMVAGGEGFGMAFRDVEVFDGVSWKSVDGLKRKRHGTGLAISCTRNEIYIASGSGKQGGSPELRSVERLFYSGGDA